MCEIALFLKFAKRANTVFYLRALANKQEFLQIFHGSGIEKMEDNLTSDDRYLIQLMDPR